MIAGTMSHSPVVLQSAAPGAAIPRRFAWPALRVLAFLGLIGGLAIVTLVSQMARPQLLTGLPDDPDLRAARQWVHGRTLPEHGSLRWTSALLGEGATSGAFATIERQRARQAAEHVSSAQKRRAWDARVSSAAAALALVQSDYRGAERGYRAAIDRNAHYGEARLGLGITLALRARFERGALRPRALLLAAIAQFAAVPAQDPARPHALWNRAVLLREVGREDEARRIAAAYLLIDRYSAWADALRRQDLAAR